MTVDDNGVLLLPGQRVRTSPHTDLWMRGLRFGTVVSVPDQDARDTDHVKVELDRRPGKAAFIHSSNLQAVAMGSEAP